MKKEELRDEVGRLLGAVSIRSDGKLEGRDSLARLKGTYDPRFNQTRDEFGRLVGRGNLLSALITADRA